MQGGMNFRIGDIMEETRKVKGAINLELTFNEPYFSKSGVDKESIKKYEIPFEKLKPIEKELLLAAKKAMENAYNPYSHFYVGAAVLTREGKIIVGANVENASYGNTLCAERTALFAANVQGHGDNIIALATIARGEDFDTEVPSAPCGLCRQAIIEFAQRSNQNIEVIFSNTEMTRIAVMKIKDLLPFAFGPADLNITDPGSLGVSKRK